MKLLHLFNNSSSAVGFARIQDYEDPECWYSFLNEVNSYLDHNKAGVRLIPIKMDRMSVGIDTALDVTRL